VRIRTTTGPGASPQPISRTTATEGRSRSSHGWAPSPPASVPRGDAVHLSVSGLLPGGAVALGHGGVQATPGGLGADLAPGTARTIPCAALRQATSTDGEVSA
jgi:hypothetical protein